MRVNSVRLERDLRAVVREGASLDELGEALSRSVARVVAHDGLMLTGRNPAEGLSAFGMAHRYEPDFLHSVQCLGYRCGWSYRCEVPSLPGMPPVVVDTAREGDCDQPLRQLLATHGIGCELRAPLRGVRGVWGVLSLLRAQGGRAFDVGEVCKVEALAPALTAVLREYVTSGPLVPTAPPVPAGVVIVRADHSIRAATPEARMWLEQMPHHRRSPLRVHLAHLAGLATQARGHARDPRLSAPMVLAPAASYGRWIISHAQPLGDGTDDVVITVQAATGRLLLPAFGHWYGLTDRERQILQHLCTGAAPKQIARHLQLSAYTINDHLKAIYRKTGATGRDELTAALTA